MSTIFRDRVDVGTLSFNNGMLGGAQYGLDTMDGWNDSPEIVAGLQPRGMSDGAFGSEVWPTSERYMTIGGWFLAPGDRVAAETARNAIILALSQREFLLTRYGPTLQQLTVRLHGRVEFLSEMEDGSRWVAQVVAPFPYKVSVNPSIIRTYSFSGGDFYRTYTDPVVARTNLVTNPSSKTSVTHWVANAGTTGVAALTQGTDATAPSGSGKTTLMTWSTAETVANAYVYAGLLSATVPAMPALPAVTYSGSLRVKPSLATQTLQARISFYDVANALLGSTSGAASVATAAAWNLYTVNAALAPAGTTQMVLMLVQTAGTLASIGSTWSISGGLDEPGAVAGTYFDGDTVDVATIDYNWVGALNLSPSMAVGSSYKTYSNVYPNFQYTAVDLSEGTSPISFLNTGTAIYPPTIRIVGPLDSGDWFLVNETTDETLWAGTNLAVGEVLTVDMMRMKATQGGYDVTHLVFGEWFGLVPGTNTIRLYAGPDNAGAYAEIIDARSAWR